MTGGLGIDIGTSSISSIIVKGGEEKSLTLKNDSSLKGEPWEDVQDPGRIMELVRQILDYSLGNDPGSIGFSGQMHGILYYDRDGKAVSPLYTWQDGRGDLPFRNGLSYADWLSEVTGFRLATGFGAVTHFYNVVNGLVPPSAVGLCTIMDYAAMNLGGAVKPLIDPSNAASIGLYDVAACRFDPDALRKAGLDPGFFPGVSGCLPVVGSFRGAPVVAAVGDNQAGFIGSVPSPLNSVLVTVGTSSQISVWTDKYSSIPGIETRPLPGGGFIMVGAALCGGSSLALLNGFLGGAVESLTGVSLPEEAIYERMDSVPFTVRTGNSLDVCTTFRGTREHPSKRGAIGNVSMYNLSFEELVLGFNRGIAGELFSFFEAMPESAREGKDRLVGSGNAIRRNKLLRKALEESFAFPVTVSGCTEEAALGACICGMAGSGQTGSPEDFWKERMS